MWEEATYLCVHTCRGKLFTKPTPSYNLESLVAAWICSDPCCHQKRKKKKGKTSTTHLFKHCQKCKQTPSVSAKRKKNQLDNTSCVQRTCATVRNSVGDFKLPEQNTALDLWSGSSATVQRSKHQTSGNHYLGDTSQESYSSNDQVTFPSPVSL